MTSVEVIIPVKNMAEHVESTVRSIRDQLASQDTITVVDDGSTQSLAERLRKYDVNVVRLETSLGPYGARHVAAAASSADVLIFTDARCRAYPGWLDAHRQLYTDSDVAMSCTGMQIVSGDSVAARICVLTGMFRLDSKVGLAGRLDFYPTANLGIRAAAYRAVGGFRKMLSGGDIDLCWRVQLQDLGRFAYNEETLMEWVPRDSLQALFNQWIRYGRSSAQLDLLYKDELEPSVLDRRRPGSTFVRMAKEIRNQPSSVVPLGGWAALMVANRLSYLNARRSVRDLPAPVSFYQLAG